MPGSPRYFRIGLLAVVTIIAGSGCALFHRDPGPIYRFARKYRAKPVPITTVALKCRDRRPDWERQYYRPLSDPQRKKRGIELLTADNFEPNPITQLKHHVTARLSELDSPPSSAEIIIKRLHVVVKYAQGTPSKASSLPLTIQIDDDDKLETQDEYIVNQVRRDDAYLTAREKWEKANRKAKANGQPAPAEPKYSDYSSPHQDHESALEEVEEEIAGAIFSVLIWSTLQTLWDLPRITRESMETARFYSNWGPPPEWAKVDPGVTCQIEGQVNLVWPDGEKASVPINVRRTLNGDISPDAPNYEITPFLAKVISQTASRVALDAASILDGKTEN